MRAFLLLSLAVGTNVVALPAAPTRRREDLGPGAGPWEVATPESQGLSTEELRTAEEAVNGAMGSRVCYLVVKNGKIVFEAYRGAGNQEREQAAFSATKGMCASLFGVAQEQGWASVDDSVVERNGGARLCNQQATFKNVLTMTGTSPDINNPRYSYDTLGFNCLDTIADFVRENNPEGLSVTDWMLRNWHERLGLTHTTWTGVGCGFDATTSCRDLARMAQLWVNDGEWAGQGQLMGRQYSIDGRQWTFPQTSREYGYTMPLRVNDAVDPQVGNFQGLNGQCARFSPEHNAVIVSMGGGGSCGAEWTLSADAIVSRTHPRYNATRVRPTWSKQQAQAQTRASAQELAAFSAAVKQMRQQGNYTEQLRRLDALLA